MLDWSTAKREIFEDKVDSMNILSAFGFSPWRKRFASFLERPTNLWYVTENFWVLTRPTLSRGLNSKSLARTDVKRRHKNGARSLNDGFRTISWTKCRIAASTSSSTTPASISLVDSVLSAYHKTRFDKTCFAKSGSSVQWRFIKGCNCVSLPKLIKAL